MRRPIPWRADTIGPWLDSLSFLTWLGSITTSALVYMFRNDGLGPEGTPDTIKGWALLLTIFFSEHIFLSVRWAVRVAISKIESPGLQKERRDRYLVRQTYVQESLNELEKKPGLKDLSMSEEQMSDRAAQEEKARQGTLGTSTVEERFWQTQRGWRAAARVGADEIERTAPETNETKKEL
jgi:anoctamin-10